MARNYRLKERGTGVTLYPETTTEQVYVPGGGNLKNLLPQMQEQINAKQPSEPGKGLSANDYTNDDKAAVGEWTEWKDSLFTIKEHTVDLRGIIVAHPQYDCTDFIPINRNVPLSVRATAGGGVPQVAFFDAGKKFISGVVVPGVLESEITDFPTGAVYFVISRFKGGVDAWYSHAPSLESIQGAAAQAIQMGKVALFDDMFAQAVGANGKVDHSHVDEDGRPAPFLCNGIWLTYEEAVRMDGFGIPTGILDKKFSGDLKCRTFYPYRKANIEITAVEAFAHNYSVEVIAGSQIKSSNLTNTFMNCRSLRSVLDLDLINKGLAYGVFQGCVKLESLTIFRLGGNMDVRDCPLITLESWQNIISRATNTTPITITVHPDVYAKLTDETNTEWHKVLTDALDRNISFATV